MQYYSSLLVLSPNDLRYPKGATNITYITMKLGDLFYDHHTALLKPTAVKKNIFWNDVPFENMKLVK